jgi:hypothetical protein
VNTLEYKPTGLMSAAEGLQPEELVPGKEPAKKQPKRKVVKI